MYTRLLSILLVLLLACDVAQAHAHLVTSAPLEGSVLDAPPTSLTLTFSESARVTALFVRKDQDPKRGIGELPQAPSRALTVRLPALAVGTYTVSWRVVGADGHVMSSEIHFAVTPPKPPAPTNKH